jgi:hypothetical protein
VGGNPTSAYMSGGVPSPASAADPAVPGLVLVIFAKKAGVSSVECNEFV